MMFERIAVLGAGTMGHGIAHASALGGFEVVLYDLDDDRVAAGLAKVQANLESGVAKGKIDAQAAEAALVRLTGTASLEDAVEDADLVIEAVPENLAMKQDLFRRVSGMVADDVVFGTNTSSLSVAAIADVTRDPSRCLGMHFFNPVHIMKLLELVVHNGTANEVVDAVRAYAVRIDKEAIVVKDVPGFATSRLGVALGMEAIRMVEQGVASAEDIDKAMVLGYRHPVGPLRLTDMVGLDVRLAIGEYLAKELHNPAFEPPALMRRMVAQGRLGQKSGEGFYRW